MGYSRHDARRRASDGPFDFSDVLPTIADVTRSKLPKNTDGTSIIDRMKGDETRTRGWVFQSSGSSKRGFYCWVRTRDWKLYTDGRLFNAGKDVMEEEPVTGPNSESIRKKLQGILNNIVMQFPNRKIIHEPKNLTQMT
ncbi:MAG: hypothetical protein ACPGLY_05365 [Rubripirellula sp.]